MPSLVLFGHKTALAGDDLPIFTLLAIALRIIQLCFLVPLLILIIQIDETRPCIHRNSNEAYNTDYGKILLISYLVVAFALVVPSFMVEVLILRTSMKGAPVETEKRKSLQPLCVVKLIPLTIIRMAALAVGILAAFQLKDYCTCTYEHGIVFNSSIFPKHENSSYNICPAFDSLVWLFRGMLIISAIEVCAAALLHLYFILQVVKPRHRFDSLIGATIGSPERGTGWNITCQFCCTCTSILTCCLFGGLEATFSDFVGISLAFEQLFDDGGLLDITLSDIINGLVLVSQEQHKHREEARKQILSLRQGQSTVTTEKNGDGLVTTFQRLEMRRVVEDGDESYSFEPCERLILSVENEVDRSAILEGAHFMRMAFGIYGYGMVMIDRPLTGPWSLFVDTIRRCWGRKRTEPKTVYGDTFCGCHKTAFLEETGLDDDAIVYANFRSGVRMRPYCVVVDKEWKAIVLVVRGTFSLEDAVADLTIIPTPLDDCSDRFGFDGQGEYVHSGMFASAEWVYDDLKEHGTLETLLSGNINSSSCLYPDYKLYVTGHSLGAGVAGLLALMLHHSYPDLKCLCFEPPGCVMTKKTADQDYITSYVLGSDIVPRLSLLAVEHLRDSLLTTIARTKVPKYHVLSPNIFGKKRGATTREIDPLNRDDSVPESPFYDQVLEFWQYQDQIKEERGARTILLLPPGEKIVHLVNTEDRVNLSERFARTFSSFTEAPYTAVWAKNEDFLEIQLASSHISDHNPGLVARALERLAETSFSSSPPAHELSSQTRGKSLGVGWITDSDAVGVVDSKKQ